MTEQSKKAYLYPQDDVSYVPVSTAAGQACGGCRWFNDGVATFVDTPNSVPHCHLVQSYPLPIRETGWCDVYTAIPEQEDPQHELIEVLESIEDFMEGKETGSAEKSTRVENVSALDRVKELFNKLRGVKARDEPPTQSGFKNVGDHQWIGWYSNNFEDLQGEYFPARAKDDFIARVDRKEVAMPELYFWHIPYRFGEVKSLARVSLDDSPTSPSFTIAVGIYDDTPIARAFEKAMGKREYPMSHGFYYAPAAKKDGAYNYYDTFEVSPLPPHAPANPFTLFEDGKAMPILDAKKRQEFANLLGEDFTKEIEKRAETRLKEIEDKGIAHKEMQLVDTDARTRLDTLQKSIEDLSEQVKAAMKKPADDEEEDAKKKPDFGAMKKEYDDKVDVLAKSVNTLAAQFKEYMEFTPRRASKSVDTLVPETDPALVELKQGATGEKSNEDKVFNAAFGAIFKGANNGA